MSERPAPSPPPSVPPATTIDEAVTTLARAVRREVQRTMLAMVAGLAGILLLLVAALGCVVAGVMRLGEALGGLCGRWFGDQALGDATVGIVLLAIPLIGMALVRLRTRW